MIRIRQRSRGRAAVATVVTLATIIGARRARAWSPEALGPSRVSLRNLSRVPTLPPR